MSVLLIGNTGVLEVTGVRDEISGAYINDATVTAAIKTTRGVTVASITLAYVASSNGDYIGTIDDGAALTNGTFYTVEVTAEANGGLIAFWRNELLARYRGFGE